MIASVSSVGAHPNPQLAAAGHLLTLSVPETGHYSASGYLTVSILDFSDDFNSKVEPEITVANVLQRRCYELVGQQKERPLEEY